MTSCRNHRRWESRNQGSHRWTSRDHRSHSRRGERHDRRKVTRNCPQTKGMVEGLGGSRRKSVSTWQKRTSRG